MSKEKNRTQYNRDVLFQIGGALKDRPPVYGSMGLGLQETIRTLDISKSYEDLRSKPRSKSLMKYLRDPGASSPSVPIRQADPAKVAMEVNKALTKRSYTPGSLASISWRPLSINYMCPLGVKTYVDNDAASAAKSDLIRSKEKETRKIFENVTTDNYETMKKTLAFLSVPDRETKEDDLLNATVAVVFDVVLDGLTTQPDWTTVQHLHVKLLEGIGKRECFWEVSAKLKEHITLNVVKVMFQCYHEYSNLQKFEKELISSSSSCSSIESEFCDGNGNKSKSVESTRITYAKLKYRSRERSLRLMQFIASLYNSQLLRLTTTCNSCQVIVDFIALHLQFPSEQNLEYICELLSLVNFPRLVGDFKMKTSEEASLHSVRGARLTNPSLLQDLLNQISTLSLNPSVSPRVRFCVQYLMNLYKNICQCDVNEDTTRSVAKTTPLVKAGDKGGDTVVTKGEVCGLAPVPLMSLSIPSPSPCSSGRKRPIASFDYPYETAPFIGSHIKVNADTQVAQELEDILRKVVQMDKKSELNAAAKQLNVHQTFRAVEKKTIWKLLAHEIVKQLENPELDPPQATTNIANFLTELFCSEESLNWLAEVGSFIEARRNLQTSSMWRVVAIHCLTTLNQMLTPTQLTEALKRTERRDLIPLPKYFAGSVNALRMSAPKVQVENDMDSLNVNEGTVSNNCNYQNGTKDLSKKRVDFLNWSDYFMGVALLSAMRSKDPITQVGACIVTEENKIVGIGYNGMPSGCDDDEFPWGKESEFKTENKYMYVCHAEMNAILNKIVGQLNGCRMYVALFPCNECAKLIIQSGIKDVIYLSNKNWNQDSCIASRRMLDAAGVTYRCVSIS
ncbi:unnamed protein product [Orchesella dallaii]|uniref:dCMP deaminase n=1 Tax=Orchesella dallaii TaxID=48710 RepID=A0ABP1Q9W2_9HEXA